MNTLKRKRSQRNGTLNTASGEVFFIDSVLEGVFDSGIFLTKNAVTIERTPKKTNDNRQSIKNPKRNAIVGVKICPTLPAAPCIPMASAVLDVSAPAIRLFVVGW